MKNLTLVLSVLALLGAAASGAMFVLIGNTKEVLQTNLASEQSRANLLTGRLAEATTHGEELQAKLSTTEAELGDTQTRLAQTDARAAQLTTELAAAKTDLAGKQKVEQQLTQETATLKRELIQAKLAMTQGATAEEAERYRRTIGELESRVSDLNKRLALASDASGDALAGRGKGDVPVGFRSSVLSVGPKSSFVVINYGAAQGARVDHELVVGREGEPFATARISEVTEQFSIAQVVPKSLRGSLKKGDSAVVTN